MAAGRGGGGPATTVFNGNKNRRKKRPRTIAGTYQFRLFLSTIYLVYKLNLFFFNHFRARYTLNNNHRTGVNMTTPLPIAIVGSGPAGLMAATAAVRAGANRVVIFEKRPAPGRKLLIAGASGLNVAYEEPLATAIAHYQPVSSALTQALTEFPPTAWLRFLTDELKLEIFCGTSGRWFVKEMKASGLLKAWRQWLENHGVQFLCGSELTSITPNPLTLGFADGTEVPVLSAVLALGGGSWEDPGQPRWPALLGKAGIAVTPFRPSNCGYHVAQWPEALIKEADRQPLKDIVFITPKGRKMGDLLITNYGLEGTPLYWMGATGPATLDLLPQWDAEKVRARLDQIKENLSPLRRANKLLPLSPAAQALLFHMAPPEARKDLNALAAAIKSLPLTLTDPRPLPEAISSAGGVPFSEVGPDLQLHKIPRLYLAGEMLDWDAPTGGLLIQGCVALGHSAGSAATNVALGDIQGLRSPHLTP
jgi:uncharacterized flavoprotein (TIGR03862 family)